MSVLPARIGRYEIVARLAAGGMGEIFLGRVLGPGGFERPVVIKRVLSHMASEPSFVEMFLDEARLVARIRHPNVVQVLELGQDGGELYLAMEYIEGESVSGLMKRLVVTREHLSPLLAAHVVAQACAGLHAAHTLTNDDGKPLDVVHRDVSPHNLLVTYAGSVKVLDFGIAKAADRLTRTDTGALKGTQEYMSPEHCMGKPIDARSDIFALGVVFYELLAGKRLFKRDNPMATFDAICRGPLAPLSAVAPGVDPLLERVCMRALARAPGERFATAADMRRELLGAMQPLVVAAAPDEELAALMGRIFADRIVEKSAMLRSVRAGAVIARVPRSEADVGVDIPTVTVGYGGVGDAGSTPDVSTQAFAETVIAGAQGSTPTIDGFGRSDVAVAPRRSRRPWIAIAFATLSVVVVGASGIALREHDRRVAAASAPAAPLASVPSTLSVGAHSAPKLKDIQRVTFGGGCQQFPSLSADGSFVVYDATVGADSRIEVLDLASGASHPITHVRGWDLAAALSPDGKRVAFLREVAGNVSTFVTGIDGGEPTKVIRGSSRPSWSRDGRSIWAGDRTKLRRVDATTGATLETIDIPSGREVNHAVELLDGSVVALLMSQSNFTNSESNLWIAPRGAGSNAARWLDFRDVDEGFVAWQGDRHLLFRSSTTYTEGGELVDAAVDGTASAVISTGGAPVGKGVAASNDGRRIVWSSCDARGTVVRRTADKGLAPLFESGLWSDVDLAWLRPTRELVVLSSRSGTLQPWVTAPGSQKPPRRLAVPWEPRDISASGDGEFIVASGPKGVFVIPTHDGAPRALTDDATDAEPRVFADGSAVLFSRITGGVWRTMTVPIAGGKARPFLEENTRTAAPSLAGDQILYLAGTNPQVLTPMVFEPATGQKRALSPLLAAGPYKGLHFSSDGHRVAMVRGSQEVVEVDLGSGTVQRSPVDDEVRVVEYAGDELLLVNVAWSGNLWMANVDSAR